MAKWMRIELPEKNGRKLSIDINLDYDPSEEDTNLLNSDWNAKEFKEYALAAFDGMPTEAEAENDFLITKSVIEEEVEISLEIWTELK